MTSEIDKARIAELEEDNARLRRLLDGRDAPGELRHRLRNTLAILRTIIRRSAARGRDPDDYAAHLEDRVEALARAQAAIDQHGEIGLHDLVADELFHYGAQEGEQVHLSGPDVCLFPRAGQVVAMAVHELAVNAVEHGALGGPAGRLTVAWTVDGTEPTQAVMFIWTETGSAPAPVPGRKGFGSEVLTGMLPYELKAETTVTSEPDGLRCLIRLPLNDRIGRVVSR